MGSRGNIRVNLKKQRASDGCIAVLYFWLCCFWITAIRSRYPLSLKEKCVKLHILSNVKHTDVTVTLFFSPFFSSLFFTLDIFSPHFPLKKHLHIWVVLAGPQKNKSGNKDTKWPRKMVKKSEFCNLIMFGGQTFHGNPSVFFRSLCEPKVCQFRLVGLNILTLLV